MTSDSQVRPHAGLPPGWNETATSYERDASVATVFEQRVDEWPQAVAVVADDLSLTYLEVDEQANRLAHRLRSMGVGRGDCVAVLADRSPQAVVAFLGIIKADATYVPLDPGDPTERRRHVLADTAARVVVVQDHLADTLAADDRMVLVLDASLAALAHESPSRPARASGGEDPIYVMYTSGSTGRPKGVVVTHRGVLRYVRGAVSLLPAADDSVLLVNLLGFDASTYEIWAALLNGARLVVHGARLFDPREVAATIRAQRVTVVFFATGMFHEVVDVDVQCLGGVRLVIVGGDVMSPARAARLVQAVPGCRLVNAYGPTETTVSASYYEVSRAAPDEPVPIGRPLANTLLYVLDEQGRPVGPGERGELCIGGDGVALGYLGLPERTAEAFVPDPFVSEPATMYRSGDIVCLRPDGELEYHGRFDHQVKIRGFRIEPAEIEAALIAHPGVDDAVVVVREDVPGHKWLVAYVATRDVTVAEDRAALRDFVAQRLPAHMVPAVVVPLEALPVTAAGKVDRAALPDPRRDDTAAEAVQATPEEQVLAAAWEDVLQVPAPRLDDDFFASGGDSLLALQLLQRVWEETGVELPLATIFGRRSLRAIAAAVAGSRSGGPGAIPPILPGPRSERAPTSVAQEQVCFLTELADDALPYQAQSVIWLQGTLDRSALERALATLVARHEIFRTTFPREAGGWVQQIHAAGPADLTFADVRAQPDPSAALSMVIRREFGTRLELDHLPLIRWVLVRVADDRHALLQIEHHVVHDGWSYVNLVGELADAYSAVVEGSADTAGQAALQYQDFARWQRALPDLELGRTQLQYWAERLKNVPGPPSLPTDRPRPSRQTYRGGSLRADLPADLVSRIYELGGRTGSTSYMVMLCAFFLLLEAYSGESDLVVGSGLANRRAPGSGSIPGMFVNTVSLRADLSGDPTLQAVLSRVRDLTLGAWANQELPFEQVVRHVAPTRDAGHTPIYQHLFSFHDSPPPDLRAPGLAITYEDTLSNGSAKSDLNVVVSNRRATASRPGEGAELTVTWEYAADLFDETTAQRLLASYLHLLDQLTSDPQRRLSDLELFDDEERGRVMAASVDPRGYERDASVVDVFADRVRDHPDSPAVVSGDAVLSYRDLDRRAGGLARRLELAGVRAGDRVAVIDDRSPSMVVALVAVLRLGAAYVGLDPALPRAHVERLAGEAGIRVACAADAQAGAFVGGLLAVVSEDEPVAGRQAVDSDAAGRQATESGAALVPRRSPAPLDCAYICFTSGSTAEPRGVEVPHRGIVRLVRGAGYVHLDGADAVLAMAPLSFDASTFEIWGALLNGARLVLAPPGPLSTGEIAGVLRAGRVTTAWFTAGLFHQMVDHEIEALASVRQILAGGDVLSPMHVDRLLQVLRPDGVLVNGYGPTETTTFATCHVLHAGEVVGGPVPIGAPIGNSSAYVLDARRRLAPSGVAGELWVGGDGVALGYLGRPDLTAELFVADPFSTDAGARLYRTGDLVRRPAGGPLEFLGRADRQLKIRGFRVEPGEVEHALAQHPAIRQTFVQGREFGRDDRRLVAYLVPASAGPGAVGRSLSAGPGAVEEPAEAGPAAAEGRPSDDDLRAFVRQTLPAPLVPSRFVWLDELPLSANGKIDAERLPAPPSGWARMHGGGEGEGPEPRREPTRTPTRFELRLLALWEEILGVRPIAPADDFFDLGGHSLLAVELFAAIERDLGARLPLATIFEAPTVEQLAAVLCSNGWDAPWRSLVPLTTSGPRRPLFFVTAGDGNTVGYGALARRLGPAQPFYALQPRGLDGCALLDASVESMARHHLGRLRSVQPRGPYLIGGRCFGTLVAFELTRLLEAAGDQVALLIALDSVGPLWRERTLGNGVPFDEVMNLARAFEPAGSSGDEVFTSRDAADRFLGWLQEPVSIQGEHVVDRYLHTAYRARPDLQRAFPLDAAGHAGLLHWGWVGGRSEMGMNPRLLATPSAAAWAARPSVDPRHTPLQRRAWLRAADCLDVTTRGRLASLVRRRQPRLLELAQQMVLRYRGGPCAAPVALIRSEEYRDDAQLARWFGAQTGGVHEYYVAGTHQSMMRDPDVIELARAVQDCVDRFSPASDAVRVD
jgi:amino acid adenylation domain-containing protein